MFNLRSVYFFVTVIVILTKFSSASAVSVNLHDLITSVILDYPKNCYEVQQFGQRKSGTYTIYPIENQGGVEVYCDMVTLGGGWTVIQRRGSKLEEGEPREHFYRRWATYELGFGSPKKDHWIGLSNIHALTVGTDQQLRIELSRWCDDDTEFEVASYGKFGVSDSISNYTLSIADYSGAIPDAMLYHNNFQFTTMDRDNDIHALPNCAVEYRGAWWYGACHVANLNGEYLKGEADYGMGIQWQPYTGHEYSLRRVEMKIRPKAMY